MTRKEYEDDLKRRQKEHLDNIQTRQESHWQPCMHDSCTECVGTGVKRDGGVCVHMLSCNCPKCSPSSFMNTGTGRYDISSQVNVGNLTTSTNNAPMFNYLDGIVDHAGFIHKLK